MTRRQLHLLFAVAVAAGTTAILTSPTARGWGWSILGSATDDVCPVATAVFLAVSFWLHGWCMGNRESDEIQASADEQEQQDSDRIDRLIELLDAARTDVADAISVGHQVSYLEGLEYLESVLDSGSLSVREQHRATAWPTSRSPGVEVLADALREPAPEGDTRFTAGLPEHWEARVYRRWFTWRGEGIYSGPDVAEPVIVPACSALFRSAVIGQIQDLINDHQGDVAEGVPAAIWSHWPGQIVTAGHASKKG